MAYTASPHLVVSTFPFICDGAGLADPIQGLEAIYQYKKVYQRSRGWHRLYADYDVFSKEHFVGVFLFLMAWQLT